MNQFGTGIVYDKERRAWADDIWYDYQFEYDVDGNLIYYAKNTTEGAADGDTTWYVWKLTWVAGECTRLQGPLKGSWTGRAALAW